VAYSTTFVESLQIEADAIPLDLQVTIKAMRIQQKINPYRRDITGKKTRTIPK